MESWVYFTLHLAANYKQLDIDIHPVFKITTQTTTFGSNNTIISQNSPPWQSSLTNRVLASAVKIPLWQQRPCVVPFASPTGPSSASTTWHRNSETQYTPWYWSQVSRTVRAESLGIYYSVNNFNACLHYWSARNAAQQKVRHIENWYTLFGKLAAPNIRTLTMCHMSLFTMGNDTYFMTFPMIRRITIFTHGDEFFDQLRASFVARISRQSNHFRWALDRSDPKFDMWPIGMFQALGDLRLEPEALRLLLTGLQLVIPCTTTSDESLIAAALLSQLESE
jgi:hypothetical protein